MDWRKDPGFHMMKFWILLECILTCETIYLSPLPPVNKDPYCEYYPLCSLLFGDTNKIKLLIYDKQFENLSDLNYNCTVL